MSTALALAFERIGKPKLLVIGDWFLDIDFHGHYRKEPAQEEPACQVFIQDPVTTFDDKRSGGAGAVANMARELGADVGDEGRSFHGYKYRYFVGNRQVFRFDHPPMVSPEPIGDISKELATAECVLIADYGRGTCTDAVLRAAIDGAKARGIPCIVDPAHGVEWARYTGATAIKCNSPEFQWILDQQAHQKQWPLFPGCGPGSEPPMIIVTRGAGGISMMGEKDTFRGRPRNAVCVVGCGDMVLAALGVCIAGGMSWVDACKVANSAAGLKVERRGAVPVPKSEVVADLRECA